MKRSFFLLLSVLMILPLFAANEIVRVAATYEYVSDNSRETPLEVGRKSAVTNHRPRVSRLL